MQENSTAPAAPKEGLRARKKRATENAIEWAAVSLALEQGSAGVTVDAICAAADISRSTFFNYFPSRESAILGRPLTILTGQPAFAVLDATAPDLFTGVFHLAITSLQVQFVNTDVARARRDLLAREPMFAHQTAVGASIMHAELVAVITEWLDLHPEHARMEVGKSAREAELVMGLVRAATAVMLEDWMLAEGDMTIDPAIYAAGLHDLSTVAEGIPRI